MLEQRYLIFFFSGGGPRCLLLGHSQAAAPQLSTIMWSEERVSRTLLPREQTRHVTGADGCVPQHVVEDEAQSP